MSAIPGSDDIKVVLTDRIGDLDDGLRLVHEGFVESGYMAPDPSGRRVIPQYLTPGIAFALATLHDEVIAVCTLIPDGPYGLPSEHEMPAEMDEARRRIGRLVEVGSLVVAREHRALSRRAVVMMFVAHFRRMFHQDIADGAVCTVAPDGARFHKSVLGMQPLGEQRMLLGAPAVLLANDFAGMRDYLAAPGGILRRTAAALFHDPDPEWLESRVGSIGRGVELAPAPLERFSLPVAPVATLPAA